MPSIISLKKRRRKLKIKILIYLEWFVVVLGVLDDEMLFPILLGRHHASLALVHSSTRT